MLIVCLRNVLIRLQRSRATKCCKHEVVRGVMMMILASYVLSHAGHILVELDSSQTL